MSKIFESLVLSSILPCVSSHITQNQHGFIPKRSTTTNLTSIVLFIMSNLSNRGQVDTICTDFKAASDSLPHNLLFSKLEKLGIGTWKLCLLPANLPLILMLYCPIFCCIFLPVGFVTSLSSRPTF